MEDAFEDTCRYMTETMELDDCKEGIQAFVEKRKPNF